MLLQVSSPNPAFLDVILIAASSVSSLLCASRHSYLAWRLIIFQMGLVAMLLLAVHDQASSAMHDFAVFAVAVLSGTAAGLAFSACRRLHAAHQSRYYELLARNRELRETKLQLVKQDEIERRMLACDLHDQVLNDLRLLRQKLPAVNDSAVKVELERLVERSMQEVREVMDNLSPACLEHLGLIAASRDCLERTCHAGQVKPCFRSLVDDDLLDTVTPLEQSMLYRLIQESLTNARKHAHASRLSLEFSRQGDSLVITIIDDGCGLPPHSAREESRGMKFMRLRAELIGATIFWHPGQAKPGTRVEIRLEGQGREKQ